MDALAYVVPGRLDDGYVVGVGEDRLRAGVAQNVRDLRPAQTVVDRHDDGLEPPQRVADLDVLDRVVGHDGDPITLATAETLEQVCGLVGAAVESRVVDDSLARDDGRLVRR